VITWGMPLVAGCSPAPAAVSITCCALARAAPDPEALLITSPARFGGTDPEPAVPAWASGSDGVGPALQAHDGAPLRWLLMDGFRADQTQPPWQEGRWAVNEWRPQPWREILADPLEEI
jgi:hypothetical protein